MAYGMELPLQHGLDCINSAEQDLANVVAVVASLLKPQGFHPFAVWFSPDSVFHLCSRICWCLSVPLIGGLAAVRSSLEAL